MRFTHVHVEADRLEGPSLVQRALRVVSGLALAAVGVHAAADLIDDRFLVVVDALDGWCDALFSRWESTSALVDWVDVAHRSIAARGGALAWEVIADALLLVALASAPQRVRPAPSLALARWAAGVCAAVFVAAGAVIVGRTVDASSFAAFASSTLSTAAAEFVARGLGLAAGGVVVTFVGLRMVRAVHRALGPSLAPWLLAATAPLAWALVLEASSWASALPVPAP